MDSHEKKEVIKIKYSEIAIAGGSCCCSSKCCGSFNVADTSKSIGYAEDQIMSAPDTNMGLVAAILRLLRN